MARQHGGELGIAFGGEDSERMTDQPEDETRQPYLETEAKSRRQSAVEDRYAARCATEQDRLGQRAMQGRLEPVDMAAQDTSAPPPKLKKLRKKLDAANAMLSPKTI